MFKTGDKSHLCTNDESFFCCNLYRSVETTDLDRAKQGPINYYNVFRIPPITKITPTNHVPELSQQQRFINTYSNPEGCQMSNFIRQNEVKMANEPLKVQQPLLECSGEMDKLQCITNTAYSPVTKITIIGTNCPSRSRTFSVTDSFNLLNLGLLKYLTNELRSPKMQYTGSLEAAENFISAKTSV